MTIAGWFTERDDVGKDAVMFESPEVCADTAVAGLYFVRDANAAVVAHGFVSFFQIIHWQNDLSRNARHRLRNKSAQTPSLSSHASDSYRNLRHVAPRNFVHPPRRTAAAGSVVFVRADRNHCGRVAVIRVFENDQVACFCVRAGETQCKLVSFAAGVHEVTNTQRIRQRRSYLLCILKNQVVQVARVSVERAHLLDTRSQNTRMTMTDVRDVVISVEISPPLIVKEILHLATHNLHRVAISNTQVSPQQPAPHR